MTPWDLQKSLIAEIEELLAQMQLKNAAGEDVFGVKGYEQRLPEITDDEEDQSQFFPYFIVRIEEGNTPTDDEPWLVGTTVLFGICDYDKETNRHRTILEMITKITNRFLERPLLDSKFRANQNVSFALQDEDTYPFYFGAIDIKFYVPKIDFNPRSLVGNDEQAEARQWQHAISIHVPSWGTTACTSIETGVDLFQSTFPRGERRSV